MTISFYDKILGIFINKILNFYLNGINTQKEKYKIKLMLSFDFAVVVSPNQYGYDCITQ